MHTVNYVYNVLYITFMIQSLMEPSSVYLHKNTDKIKQTSILLK